MAKTVSFARLRDILGRLGFLETIVPGSHVRFEHPPTETLLVLREYRAREAVTPGDLAMVRRYLDERGILERADFEHQLLGQAG